MAGDTSRPHTSRMDSPVGRTIAETIRRRGPISFAEYMEMALYGHGGFYERPPVGPGGDFVTSPHIHPVFAELLAGGLRQTWELLGRPDPFRVMEVGAGDGTLAAQLLANLSELPVDYTAVERSPGARAALAEVAGVRSAAEPSGAPDLVLANELLDNLPFRRVRMTRKGPREVRVGLEGEHLVEVLALPDEGARAAASGLERGDETVIPEGALSFVDTLGERLPRGYALLIDYGAERGPGGDPHGYREHRVVHDLLEVPGTADITAGVDLAQVAARAVDRGLQAFPSVTQRRALAALGFETWSRGELRRQHRLLQARDGAAAVRTWSARSRATLLVDPAALGRSRWLLLASAGLPMPPWLEEARGAPRTENDPRPDPGEAPAERLP
jgi:NADH dehydrogenase [ubiquinone] 1 alpha subcomplex assembly factor 7